MTQRQLAPVIIAAALAGGAGFLLASADRGPATATTVAAAAPSASEAATSAEVVPSLPLASASASASASSRSVLELAAAGDLGALKQLELRPAGARSTEEALAIAEGHAALARADAARLVADLEKDPALFADRGTMAYTYRLALDPDVAPVLLAGLARLQHPAAADLLFDLATRGEPGARLTLLAEDLLAGPAVRPEATKALAVALEVRAAEACARVLELVPRVAETADDRVVPLLSRFRDRKGCGPKNEDDCWSCLREADRERAFEDAAKAAEARPFDPPWSPKPRQRSK